MEQVTGLFRPGSRLLVFGYFGGRNFGDELMLLGLLEEARKSGVAETRIVTPAGELPSRLAPEVSGAYPRSALGILSGLRWADGFVVCGGTVLHDAFPGIRYREYRRVLVTFALLCCLARAMTRRVILAGVGIGPVHRPLSRLMTWLAVRAAHLVTVRDRSSLEDLLTLGISGAKVRLGDDLSMSAVPAIPHHAPQAPPLLSVSVVPANLTSTVETLEAERFLVGLADALGRFATRHPDWRIAVLEVAVGTMDNDAPVADFLVSRLTAPAPSRIERVTFDGDPRTFLDLLAASSAVIASRYHIATAAELISAPTLWIPYARKVADGAKGLKVPSERIQLPSSDAVRGISDWLERSAGG